jgi:drug/metabolite transporter (DMT)-like permease
MLLATPLLWAWCRWEKATRPRPSAPLTRSDIVALVLAGLLFAGDMALWNWSLHLTTVANSTLITNLTPLLVMLAARVLFGEPITGRYLLGMPLALLGAACLVRAGSPTLPDHWRGDLVSAAATLFYAGYLLALRRLRQRLSSAVILFASGWISTLVLFGIAVAAGHRLMPSAGGWLPLVGLAVVSHVGGQGFIAYGFGHVSAAVGSLILLVQPVVAGILAWLLLAEPLGPRQVIGGVLVLLGLGVASRR